MQTKCVIWKISKWVSVTFWGWMMRPLIFKILLQSAAFQAFFEEICAAPRLYNVFFFWQCTAPAILWIWNAFAFVVMQLWRKQVIHQALFQPRINALTSAWKSKVEREGIIRWNNSQKKWWLFRISAMKTLVGCTQIIYEEKLQMMTATEADESVYLALELSPRVAPHRGNRARERING